MNETVAEQKFTKGDLITLSLDSWGRLGEAMGQHQGRDVFVFGGIPGERVEAEVLRVHRKYLAARVCRVLEASPFRVEAPCRYFGQCTGCQWQHVDYAAQLDAKRAMVRDALERVGGMSESVVDSVIPSEHQLGYRNHARFTVGPRV